MIHCAFFALGELHYIITPGLQSYLRAITPLTRVAAMVSYFSFFSDRGDWPYFDLIEKSKYIVVNIDLPGVEDITVEYVDNKLMISGM